MGLLDFGPIPWDRLVNAIEKIANVYSLHVQLERDKFEAAKRGYKV